MIGPLRALATLGAAAFDAAMWLTAEAVHDLWERTSAHDAADLAADRLADKEAEQEVSEPSAVRYTESAAQALRDASWPHGRNWDGYPDAEAARLLVTTQTQQAFAAQCSDPEFYCATVSPITGLGCGRHYGHLGGHIFTLGKK